MTDNITKENAPSVTVIIPVYNGMSTLPECLDSLKALDYPGALEFIIVDDGSTDQTAEYCESRSVKVIKQKNRGPGVARNTGAREAKGDYLIFTDADCVVDPDFVTELIRPLIGTDIIGSQGQFYSLQKNLVARFIQHEILERVERLKSSEYTDWIATYAACYRKDVFLENGGFSDIYSSEDVELSFRLAGKGYKMVMAPKARCQHRNYENFFKFLRFKYKRAYWTIWLYKRFPERIVHDRLTPSTRKTMMLMMAAAAAFLILGCWYRFCLYIGFFWAALLIASTVPFALKVLRRGDFIMALLSPLFLIARTASYIVGFIKGLTDYWRGVRTVKRSAAK